MRGTVKKSMKKATFETHKIDTPIRQNTIGGRRGSIGTFANDLGKIRTFPIGWGSVSGHRRAKGANVFDWWGSYFVLSLYPPLLMTLISERYRCGSVFEHALGEVALGFLFMRIVSKPSFNDQEHSRSLGQMSRSLSELCKTPFFGQ
jgi:hypothetical protein